MHLATKQGRLCITEKVAHRAKALVSIEIIEMIYGSSFLYRLSCS